jgi:hypothetical protein
VVVVNDAPGLRINPVLWQELKGAEDEAAEAAAALKKLGPHVPVPFWLAFLPPTPRAVLMADLNDEEPGEILPLPGVDQIDQWPDVDPELVAEAATSSLVLTMGSWTHPLTYRRGSRKRDLVARPLRTVREWLAIYPALVSEPLGGGWRDPSEWQQCMGPGVIPFWEVLDLPAELRDRCLEKVTPPSAWTPPPGWWKLAGSPPMGWTSTWTGPCCPSTATARSPHGRTATSRRCFAPDPLIGHRPHRGGGYRSEGVRDAASGGDSVQLPAEADQRPAAR